MPDSSEEYTYRISVHDFDKSLLPTHARKPGTDKFSEEVSKALRREYAEFGGWVQIVVNQESIQVTWKADPARPNPHEVVVEKLERGERVEAIRLMERLRHHEPNNIKLLCNLGMALSEVGLLDASEQHLRHALEIDPNQVAARIALGVVLVRKKKTTEALPEFQAAVEIEPSNPWALRNLAAVLGEMGRLTEAEPHYRKTLELNPEDQQAVYGLATCLVRLGNDAEAHDLFVQANEMDSTTSVAELARKELTDLAQRTFRAKVPAGVRPDAVMYCLGAIKTFENMPQQEVQKIGFEIAVMGQQGLDPNDSTPKYRLKSMPGEFSGLHLICKMYVAFKIVAPQHDLGFDLGKEYAVAQTMHRDGDGGSL